METVRQLFPVAREVPLQGLYLSHDLRRTAQTSDEPYIYANFIASVDGRIAIPDPRGKGLIVPEQTANERDWRLFQELAAQADLIISSGRYLRDWADGKAQEILQVDDPRFSDLRDWRRKQGLAPQPDIAILSGSLRFPIPDVLTSGGRKVVVFTTADPDPERVAEIEARAGRVFVAGEQSVDGARMAGMIKELGYRLVYSATGPKVLHLLLEARVLDRLYMTYASRLLGGTPFATIVDGALLAPAVDLRIEQISLDPAAPDGLGQMFVVYDCA